MTRSLALVLLAGCAPAVWNKRSVDCTDAGSISYYADRVQLFGEPGDKGCEMEIRGLKGSRVEVADEITVNDADDVSLWLEAQRALPSTRLNWSDAAEVQLGFDDDATAALARTFVLSGRDEGEATVGEDELAVTCGSCDVQASGPYETVHLSIGETERDVLLDLAVARRVNVAVEDDAFVGIEMLDEFELVEVTFTRPGGTLELTVSAHFPVDLDIDGTLRAYDVVVSDTDGAESVIRVVGEDIELHVWSSYGTPGGYYGSRN